MIPPALRELSTFPLAPAVQSEDRTATTTVVVSHPMMCLHQARWAAPTHLLGRQLKALTNNCSFQAHTLHRENQV
eukprot:COSAG01_NODE_24809_length_765_cov_9.600694_1_plen_74_part_10